MAGTQGISPGVPSDGQRRWTGGKYRETQPDLVLNPAAYWQLSLQRRVDGLVQKELGPYDSHKPDHVVVNVSVTGRSERKLVKRFEADTDWRERSTAFS